MQGFNQIDTMRSVLVSVPINARLKRLREQQEALRKQAENFRRQLAQAEASLNALDRRAVEITGVADLRDIATERQTLKIKCDQLEFQQRDAEGQLRRVSEETEAWTENFAEWTFRRQQLIVELATAPDDGGATFYMTAVGHPGIRNKATVETELQAVSYRLENFSK